MSDRKHTAITEPRITDILHDAAFELERGADAGEVAPEYGVTITIEPGYYADDGNAEVYFLDATSADEAAQEYVDDGDWTRRDKTWWCSVRTWRRARIALGDESLDVDIDTEDHKVQVDPEEPECGGGEHDWRSPIELVGGDDKNPGVWAHDGGVVIHEACVRCGCQRITDTWATDLVDGEQGLQSVEYREDEYDVDDFGVDEGQIQ